MMPLHKTSNYHLIDAIAGATTTPEGDLVAINCKIDGEQQYYAVQAHEAFSLAISLMAGAETCGYIQQASAEEKSDPAFSDRMQEMTTEIEKRLICAMMPSESDETH